METVIYGDVLVAVNFVINLAVLGLTRKLTGIPVKRGRRYLGALAGALAAFVIFLPAGGLLWDIAIRAGVTALVIGVTYWGQSVKNMLRLSAVFFTVGFLLAGFIMGLWFLVPDELLTFANGIFYFNVTPLVLLGCVAVAYLFVSLFDRLFDGGNTRGQIWQATVRRNGRAAEISLFMDTGNHLVEPFSGLPVLVVGLQSALPLLTEDEMGYITGGRGTIPQGLRPVFFTGVGSEGLLCAFRPDDLRLAREGASVSCDGYVAVSLRELDCQGCSGIFNPRLLGMASAVR